MACVLVLLGVVLTLDSSHVSNLHVLSECKIACRYNFFWHGQTFTSCIVSLDDTHHSSDDEDDDKSKGGKEDDENDVVGGEQGGGGEQVSVHVSHLV